VAPTILSDILAVVRTSITVYSRCNVKSFGNSGVVWMVLWPMQALPSEGSLRAKAAEEWKRILSMGLAKTGGAARNIAGAD
jgi:hypothetical protein